MEKLGSAIIGCGSIYKSHADSLQMNQNSQIVAVVDINAKRAKEASEIYNCKFYTDYEEMLKNEEVQVVHICTPHYLHAPMAIDAMKAGKHVLVEKPVAINVSEAEEMAKVAKANNKKLSVCFQNRYNSTYLKVKQIIDEGRLGAIKGIKGLVTWYRNEEYYTNSLWRGKWKTEGGGVLINQAIHTLDFMQYIAGPVKRLKGNVDTRLLKNVIEVEDTADVTLQFESGAVGIFFATNSFTRNSSVDIEIHCEKGVLRINEEELVMDYNGKKEYITRENNVSNKYKDYWGKSHGTLIQKFYQCIIEDDFTGYITAEEGVKSLKLIEAIYKSSAEGNYVSIAF